MSKTATITTTKTITKKATRTATRTAAIIVAAGQGVRLGTDQPKQYHTLGGKTILSRTLDVFLSHESIDQLVCLIHPDHETSFLEGIGERKDRLIWTHGGQSRQDSVQNGLAALKSLAPDYVLIHDAARPFVSNHVIDNVISGLETYDGAIPAVAVADSLKWKKNGSVENIDREGLFHAQTPQGFLYDKILQAHQQAREKQMVNFTDDAGLAEWAGLNIGLVEGARANFKITTGEDYEMARALCENGSQIRLGHGYDVHAFEEGAGVVLCGVQIDFDKKLKGHSDADVALHAITDAIYGSLGEGDIGHHFPPTDNQWKQASSDIFLRHAVDIVAKNGGTIANLDLTIVCEAPKIGPHREKMRQSIASITGLDISQISVKATTSEGLGFTGRGEGIAAYATALVRVGGD